MSDWDDCPNGCGEQVRVYWNDDFTALLPPMQACLWCRGSYESGAAVAFGLMGMAFAIQDRNSLENDS